MRFLITGTAGFIGFHLARRLVGHGHEVVGFDGLSDHYDRSLKDARHAILARHGGFRPVIGRLEDMDCLQRAADLARPDVIVHLAAQAGVRYSIREPGSYVDSNLVGSFNLLEVARRCRPDHLLVASTSSVYGRPQREPTAETDRTDFPLSLYGATKKAVEVMSFSYAHLFSVPTTCLRFFTVYGPWGRPDMALFKFVDAISSGRPIDVYGFGRMRRDFTYVDDLVEALVRLIPLPPGTGEGTPPDGDGGSGPPWRVLNVGGGRPIALMHFIEVVEDALGRRAEKVFLPMQPGDVPETFADNRALERLIGYRPQTPLEVGVPAFVAWYRDYFAARGQPATMEAPAPS